MTVSKKLGLTAWICILALAALGLTGCQSNRQQFAEIPGLTVPVGEPGVPAEPAAVPVAPQAPRQSPGVTKVIHTAPNPAAGLDLLRVGDTVKITFSDMPALVPPIEQRIKEDGTLTLLHNKQFVAAGKTRGQLEREIRDAYVPKMYVEMTVTVDPQSASQFYYVGGEVKQPGRQVYITRITVLKAIQSAGDFTDFANRRKIKLTRQDGKLLTVDGKKALEDATKDLEVFPGDKIHVPRKLF